MDEQTQAVLRTAEAVLSRKQKIETAIEDQVKGLSGLILTVLQTEREFHRQQCNLAIGEAASGTDKARKAMTDARSSLDQASFRLGGFRAQLSEMGGSFVGAYDQLAEEIPRCNAQIAESFKVEWREAAAAWQVALGRRAAFEKLLGYSLTLDEPIPAPVDVGDLVLPSKTLTDLGEAIKRIANLAKVAQLPLVKGNNYDSRRIYILTSNRMESRGLPYHSLVCDASFEPGRLAQQVGFEEARPVQESDFVEGVRVAAAKAAQIDKAAADAASAKSALGNQDENLKRSGRMPDLSYQPTQADLDRDAEKVAQIRARSIGPEDQEHGANHGGVRSSVLDTPLGADKGPEATHSGIPGQTGGAD